MIIPLRNPAAIGIIKDIEAHDLPIEAWSDGSNMRFRDGRAEKFSGHSRIYDSSPPAAGAYYIMPYFKPDGSFAWMICGLDDIWQISSSAYTEFTRLSGDYTGSASDRWNGAVFGGSLILNNGVDAPQQLEPGDTKFTDLDYITGTSTWGNTDGTTGGAGSGITAKVIRAFRDQLIALDVTNKNLAAGSQRDPYMIKWSHYASAGAVPNSWNPSDTSKAAGEFSLIQTPDYLVDCLPLGDVNIVYKEDTTWVQRFVGFPAIYEFDKIPDTFGMMGQQCAVEVNGMHLVKTLSDLVVHNGQQIVKSVVDKKWRRWIQNNIDTDNYSNSYMVKSSRGQEAWFCFPTVGNTFPDIALVWNWKDDNLSVRELPGARHIAEGITDPVVEDGVDALGGTADQLTGIYDQRFYDPISRQLLMAEDEDTEVTLSQLDTGETFNGTVITADLRRDGIPLNEGKSTKQGKRRVRRVTPYISGTIGSAVQVRVGTQVNDRYDDIQWSDWKDYTIGVTRKLDFRVTGRYMSLHIRSNENAEFVYDGCDIDVVEVSQR